MSSIKINKKAQGAGEGLSLLAVMITMAAIALVVFSFSAWDKNKKANENKVLSDAQDSQRIFNSFMSIKLEGQTMRDSLIKSIVNDDFSEFEGQVGPAFRKYYSEDACLQLYVDDKEVYSTNILLSCKPGLLSEMKMPAYGKDAIVRMIIG